MPMNRRWSSLAILGAMVACLWTSTAAVRADQVVLFTSDAAGGANCVRILSGGPTSNYVTNDIVSVYRRSGNNQNSLLLFDLSSIPAGKTIKSATLTLWHDTALYFTGDNFSDTYVFRATKPWVQWQTTWTRTTGYRTSNAVFWDQPGGDFVGIKGQTDGSDPYADGVLGLDDASPGVFQFDLDVTSLVSEWYTS